MIRIGAIFFFVAVVFVLSLGTAKAGSDVQMLPPTNVGTTTPCTFGSGQVLAFNDTGATAGDSVINCNNNLTISSSGLVTIGTTSPPATTLSVNMTNYGSPRLAYFQSTDGDYSIPITFNNQAVPCADGGQWGFGINGGSPSSFSSMPVGAFWIHEDCYGAPMVIAPNGGGVGIGTSNPSGMLDILKPNSGLTQSDAGGLIFLVQDGLARWALASYGDIDGATLADYTSTALGVWSVSGTGRSITTSGSIYIGGTNGAPTDPGGWGDYWDGTSIMTVGRVGIGTTGPGGMLDIFMPNSGQLQSQAGSMIFRVQDGYARPVVTMLGGVDGTPITGDAALNVGGAGVLPYSIDANHSINAALGFSQNSDRRLKTNIKPLPETSGLAAIDALKPVTFNWIDPNKGTSTQMGFIAQDMQSVFPDLVTTASRTKERPDGYLSLNYIGLITPLVKAVQEVYGKWQVDHDDIAALKAQVAAQGKEIEALKAAMKKAP
jgi:hypothetical protein